MTNTLTFWGFSDAARRKTAGKLRFSARGGGGAGSHSGKMGAALPRPARNPAPQSRNPDAGGRETALLGAGSAAAAAVGRGGTTGRARGARGGPNDRVGVGGTEELSG